MTKVVRLVSFLLLLVTQVAFAQTADELKKKIQQIVSTKNVVVGVSVVDTYGKETVSINGDRHFPLQSVFKLHIALTVLSQIDKGKFSLDQKINVQKKELMPGLWSPLREENPNGGSFTIARLIQYSVSQSDNVACDVLIRLLGKPKAVEEYIKKSGIKDIAIHFNEEDMQAKWDNMFQNWTTPKAASETLKKFYENDPKLLSPKSYNFIWKTMRDTETGQDRLKGMLPKGTIVAHKTGSSGTNKEGITAAVNDIGVVFLPNGKHFIISVFVTESKENDKTNEKIIADVASATWDHFTAVEK